MTKNPEPLKIRPPQELRISSVLRKAETRDEVAKLAESGEWSHVRALNASSELVADHLSKAKTPQSDAEFFDSRRFSEAIVLLKARPVLLIRDNLFERAPLDKLEARLARHRKSLAGPIASVGRIELMDHDTLDWCGTGWRIEDDLIVTNRHVANLFAQRQGNTFSFRLSQAGRRMRARVDFKEEYRQEVSEEHMVAAVLWVSQDISEAPDIAFLRIVKDAGLPKPLKLARADPGAQQEIAVVGYPARDSRNDASAMQDVFGDIYDVKRFAPGEVVSVPRDSWYLTHDCSTLGGNSGSAALDIATGEVVGLHFGGEFRKTNYAVKASVIKSLLKRRSWVPVRPSELGIPTEAFSEKKRTVKSMAGRTGFASRFLGVTADVPQAGSTHDVRKHGDKNLLHYTHFSVQMSETRRLPIFTAVNIDGALKKTLKRKDAWGFDPRIPEAAQVGHKEFYGPASFDTGHMVRREDPGWGSQEKEALLGEEDSFVYTNAVPQVPQLNQKSWLSLEDYVLQNAKTRGFKVSVFTGPVFRQDDPIYEDIAVPLDFWKVVAMIDADTDELCVSAYMLGQEGMMPTEGFRYGPFKTYQVPLSKVAEDADLKFARALHDADVFAGAHMEEATTFGRFVEITGPGDVLLTRPTAAAKAKKSAPRKRKPT
jgi:endonuclease G